SSSSASVAANCCKSESPNIHRMSAPSSLPPPHTSQSPPVLPCSCRKHSMPPSASGNSSLSCCSLVPSHRGSTGTSSEFPRLPLRPVAHSRSSCFHCPTRH